MPTTPVPPTTGRWCPACGRMLDTFAPGPGGRPEAACPGCWSLERHRFLALLLDGLGPWLSTCSLVVDVAPSRQVSGLLRRLAPRAYLSLDFDPAADGRPVDVRASLTELPLADASVDFLLCYHVLEHVPDDDAAVREIARVLAPAGLALVQVPWESGQPTDEDPAAPEAERVARFGQADHIRLYGSDFEDRLRAGGLFVLRRTPGELLGDQACELMRLAADESVWLVSATPLGARDDHRRPEGGGRAVTDLVRLMTAAQAEAEKERRTRDLVEHRLAESVRDLEKCQDQRRRLDAELVAARGTEARLRSRLTRARADAARWRASHDRLRGRLPVRVMTRVSRALRRLSPR